MPGGKGIPAYFVQFRVSEELSTSHHLLRQRTFHVVLARDWQWKPPWYLLLPSGCACFPFGNILLSKILARKAPWSSLLYYFSEQKEMLCSSSMAQLQNVPLPISSLIPLATGQIRTFPYRIPLEGFYLSEYPYPKRTHLQVTQKLLGDIWVTGSTSSFVRIFFLSFRIPSTV